MATSMRKSWHDSVIAEVYHSILFENDEGSLMLETLINQYNKSLEYEGILIGLVESVTTSLGKWPDSNDPNFFIHTELLACWSMGASIFFEDE